ncbi:hypothetical protein ABZT47_21210 [Sphaerisporangium sp. NPDC005289]|uniref:hypothetical protein n=1 Tax=Sphaerisporangium sp. NPDC005289 TaxID=3155247 RepID=UPI0033B80B85
MHRFKFFPVFGPIILCIGPLYTGLTVPGDTASTAAVIRWAGMGITTTLFGVGLMLCGIMAVLIQRFKDENHASGGGARLRGDHPNEPVEP